MKTEIEKPRAQTKTNAREDQINEVFYTAASFVLQNLPDRKLLLNRLQKKSPPMSFRIGEEKWKLTIISDRVPKETPEATEEIHYVLMTTATRGDDSWTQGIITDKDMTNVIGVCIGGKRLRINPFNLENVTKELKEASIRKMPIL